jgi:hypothetical protein
MQLAKTQRELDLERLLIQAILWWETSAKDSERPMVEHEKACLLKCKAMVGQASSITSRPPDPIAVDHPRPCAHKNVVKNYGEQSVFCLSCGESITRAATLASPGTDPAHVTISPAFRAQKCAEALRAESRAKIPCKVCGREMDGLLGVGPANLKHRLCSMSCAVAADQV